MSFTYAVIDESLAGWVPVPATLPDDIPQRLTIEVRGDSSYASGGETIDVSAYFDVVLGSEGSGYPIAPQGALYTRLTVVAFTPSAVKLVVLDGTAQVAGSTNLGSAKWILVLIGKKHFT